MLFVYGVTHHPSNMKSIHCLLGFNIIRAQLKNPLQGGINDLKHLLVPIPPKH